MLDPTGEDAAFRVVSWVSWITNAFQLGSVGAIRFAAGVGSTGSLAVGSLQAAKSDRLLGSGPLLSGSWTSWNRLIRRAGTPSPEDFLNMF